MAKLKKTLPKNVNDLVINKDWETLKTELEKCEPMAYEHFGAGNSLKAKHILFVYKSSDTTPFDFGLTYYCLSADMVDWIISKYNFDLSDRFWKKLLNFYIEKNQTEVVKLLLEKGFDPNPNEDLESALTMGQRHRGDIVNLEIVELLLEHGAEVQGKDDEFSKPLHTLLWNIWTFDDRAYALLVSIRHFERLLDNFPKYLKMIELLITYGKKYNVDIKHPKLQEAVEAIRQKFYEKVYSNQDFKQYYSESELEGKLNQLEQFELKLYELMQFEPQ